MNTPAKIPPTTLELEVTGVDLGSMLIEATERAESFFGATPFEVAAFEAVADVSSYSGAVIGFRGRFVIHSVRKRDGMCAPPQPDTLKRGPS